MANPQVDLRIILAPERTEVYLTRIQTRAAVTEEQQVVHEPVQPPDAAPVEHPPLAGDAQDGHGLPQVAPAPRERAGPHGLRQRQEGQHVLQGLVREGAKPIVPASRARHYVEQVASSEAVDLGFEAGAEGLANGAASFPDAAAGGRRPTLAGVAGWWEEAGVEDLAR